MSSIDLYHMGKETLPSVIKNPFTKDYIKSISVRYERKIFGKDGEWQAIGRLEFQNGETTGTQKFEGETFDEVVLQMKACINQLINNQK